VLLARRGRLLRGCCCPLARDAQAEAKRQGAAADQLLLLATGCLVAGLCGGLLLLLLLLLPRLLKRRPARLARLVGL
jgi:hypothetical protein